MAAHEGQQLEKELAEMTAEEADAPASAPGEETGRTRRKRSRRRHAADSGELSPQECEGVTT